MDDVQETRPLRKLQVALLERAARDASDWEATEVKESRDAERQAVREGQPMTDLTALEAIERASKEERLGRASYRDVAGLVSDVPKLCRALRVALEGLADIQGEVSGSIAHIANQAAAKALKELSR